MKDAGADNYLNGRFAEALDFYDARAMWNKKWYRRLSLYIIVVSGGLSPLVAFGAPVAHWRALAAVLSASIVVVSAVLGHFKFHENWLSFRGSWDALQREREHYKAHAGDYRRASDPDALFVERVEALLARESAEFFLRHEPRAEQPKPIEKPK